MDVLFALIGLLIGGVLGSLFGASKARAQQIDSHSEMEKKGKIEADKLIAEAKSESKEIKKTATDEANFQRSELREERNALMAKNEETKAKGESLRLEAEKYAENIRQKAQQEAEESEKKLFLRMKEQAKAQEQVNVQEQKRQDEFEKSEQRLTKREDQLEVRAQRMDAQQVFFSEEEKRIRSILQSAEEKNRELKERLSELDKKVIAADEKLLEVAALSREKAKEIVIESVKLEAEKEATKEARILEENIKNEAEKRAQKILAMTIQRYAGEYVAERVVNTVVLPNDAMKGRIIGREGRNIRAIEAATAVDIIIDDTPGVIVISSFDPIRREIARRSLERLMSDGRIHPGRIEDVVNKTKKEVNKIIQNAGEEAVFEIGLSGFHLEIVKMIGRLKYRTSYGQNIWKHSIEVGFLCGLMAGELGINVGLARRAGFLHDIGKAMDHELEGSHALIGANFIKKFGEKPLIVNAVAAHHEEVKPTSVIALLVMAADALSGARPGARREVFESYIKRLEDMETISRAFSGVTHSFAIQAGREIRVIVSNKQVNDQEAVNLSRKIARKIEEELVYPGQIKVTVIREMRASEVAR